MYWRQSEWIYNDEWIWTFSYKSEFAFGFIMRNTYRQGEVKSNIVDSYRNYHIPANHRRWSLVAIHRESLFGILKQVFNKQCGKNNKLLLCVDIYKA